MTAHVRSILRTGSQSRSHVQNVLQAVFCAELLAPSPELWVVSPWLRDIPVVDNSAGSFGALGVSGRELSLFDALLRLAEVGAQVFVVAREKDNVGELQVLEQRRRSLSRPETLSIVRRPSLHAKGLLGESYSITGSMNFTHNGIRRWEEMLRLSREPGEVSELRLAFKSEYGSADG